jgi:hypothetical protein
MFVKEMENAETKKTYWYRIWFFCNYGMDEKTKDPRKLNQFIEDIMDAIIRGEEILVVDKENMPTS